MSARSRFDVVDSRKGPVSVYSHVQSFQDEVRVYLALAFIVRPDWFWRWPTADIDGATEAGLVAAIPETQRQVEAEGIQRVRDYILNHDAIHGDDDIGHRRWEDSFLASDYSFQIMRD